MQARCFARHVPASQNSSALLERVVYAGQLSGHEVVVVAKLKQLGIRVFEELDSSLCTGGRVVNESAVPTDHGQIVWIVRDASLQDLLELAVGQRRGFPADDLSDLRPMLGKQIRCRGRSARQSGQSRSSTPIGWRAEPACPSRLKTEARKSN